MKKTFLALIALLSVTLYGSYINPGSGSSGSGSTTWGSITGTLSSQTDLNSSLSAKAPADSPTFTTKSTHSYATATTVPVFNGSKELTSSAVTPTELGYLSGVSSAIQTQFSGKVNNTGNESIAGIKTFPSAPIFSSTTASSLLSVDGSKALTVPTVSSPLTFTTNTLACQAASGSQAGCLSSADWTTFNNKTLLSGGTTFRLTRWLSSSTVGSSNWDESSAGYLRYSNSTNKGSATQPIVDLNPTTIGGAGAGLYSDSGKSLFASGNGKLSFGFDGTNDWFAVYGPADASKYVLIKPATSAARFQFGGTSGDEYNWYFNLPSSHSTTAYMRMHLATNSEGSTFYTTQAFNPSHTSLPGLIELSGNSTQQTQFLMVGRGGGVTIGGGVGQRSDMPTLGVKAIQTYNISGTSSVSGTTMTGTSTLYTQDLAVGDRISPDNGSTFAYVIQINSNTQALLSNTVTASGATIRRYPAAFRTQDQAKLVTMLVNDQGNVQFGASTAFTESANAKVYVEGTAKAKRIVPTVVTLVDGASVTLDASAGGDFVLTATGNRQISVPTNPVDGQKITIRHVASGGSRTLSLTGGAGGFSFGEDITSLTATTSGKVDYIGCIYNSTSNRWHVVAVTKGY